MSFEPNRGQADPSVKFVSHGAFAGPGYTLFLTADGAVFEFLDPAKNHTSAMVRMRLAGSRSAQISAADPLPGKVNYFIGNDSKKWIVGAPTYRKVDYKMVYPGIDLTFYGTQQQIEYDFVVASGADARQISLQFSGAAPKLGAGGQLELTLHGARLRLLKPVAYQLVDGTKKLVAARYTLDGDHVQFALGRYDHSRPLVIDPVFQYLTWLGGAGGLPLPVHRRPPALNATTRTRRRVSRWMLRAISTSPATRPPQPSRCRMPISLRSKVMQTKGLCLSVRSTRRLRPWLIDLSRWIDLRPRFGHRCRFERERLRNGPGLVLRFPGHQRCLWDTLCALSRPQ